MENYKDLGTKYLRKNRKRSVLTVLGCLIVAAVLFAFLNVMCCWIDYCRAEARKVGDYEIVILSDDETVLQSITNEDFVRSAYLGKEFDYESNTEYGNALHINVKNILMVKRVNSYIQDTYNVKTILNSQVLWTYMMDDEGTGFMLVAGGLFIAYIFAIIGIGIIRNSVQLSALERIKDYGNLRCIGATKKQIKAIVFRESFILESIGIAGGVALGFLVSIPIALSLEYPVGFHFIPLILVLVAFNFDLYFAIGDGVKKVLSVSPVEAVRGSFHIRNRKIRRIKSGIWGLIFGVEGDYAYKNIRRNTGRFLKTTGAMSFGLGVVVVIGSVLGVFIDYLRKSNDKYGYYQQYLEADTNTTDTMDELQAQLYSPEALEVMQSSSAVKDMSYVYHDTLYASERDWVFEHLNEKFYKESTSYFYYDTEEYVSSKYGEGEWDNKVEEYFEKMKSYRDSGKGLVDYDALNFDPEIKDNQLERVCVSFGANEDKTLLDIYGYDEKDYARYKDSLVEGTLDLSENGILLVNQATMTQSIDYTSSNDDSFFVMPEDSVYTMTDLKLGDEITIVDPVELDKLVQEEMKLAREYDQKHKVTSDDGTSDASYVPITESIAKKNWIIESARQRLAEEGKTKTYVIEGILDSDPNRNVEVPTIIVPLDRYFEITGQNENDYTGFHFHISNVFSSDFSKTEFHKAFEEKRELDENGFYIYDNARMSYFIDDVVYYTDAIKQFLLLGGVILVVVLVSAFNTMNTAISNLQLRRNEFAQLRALGMTKGSLLKAVTLEGGIVWIISSILGIAGGTIVEYYMYKELLRLVVATDFTISWGAVIIAMLLELIVLCGTNMYVIRNMKLDVASELTRSGE